MAQQHDFNQYPLSDQRDTPAKDTGLSFADVESKDLPPMIGSGALLLFGLSRRSLTGLFLAGIGGGLLYRQLQQKNVLPNKSSDSASDQNRKRIPSSQIVELQESIIVHQPIDDVFAFWSDLQNLPRFMDHIKNIQKLDDIRSHWQAFIPFTNQVIEWDAEIIEFEPNNLIRWQSVADADIFNRGTVRFQRLPNGNGTRVTATICYRPPAGVAGQITTQFLKNIPSDFIRTDMERFRRLLEGTYPHTGIIDNDISF